MHTNKELSLLAEEKEILSLWKKAKATDKPAVLDFFKERVLYLQHERLIHLLVTLFFGAITIFLFPFVIGNSNQYFILIFLLILIPTIFYVFHYYRLENTCQHWQELAITFRKKLLKKK